MLQYLTDDLMEGYGLPKKRKSVSDQISNFDTWSLVGATIEYDNWVIARRLTNAIAIGRDKLTLICTLHSNGMTLVAGEADPYQVFDMDDLHYYLDF
jgi:hypothetical protein